MVLWLKRFALAAKRLLVEKNEDGAFARYQIEEPGSNLRRSEPGLPATAVGKMT